MLRSSLKSLHVRIKLRLMVAIGTALYSQSIDYAIGLGVSDRFINNLIGKKRYEKAEARIEKYGNFTIFLFNALPLSSPVISLAAGMIRHPVRGNAVCTVSGLLVKYIAMTLIF